MLVMLLNSTFEAEKLTAGIGRVCHSGKRVRDIFKNLSQAEADRMNAMLEKRRHISIFENATFLFGIEGISRITEIQLIRHRMSSPSVQSGRHVNRDNVQFTKPPRIRSNPVANEIFDDIANHSRQAYNDIFLALMLELMGCSASEIRELGKDERIETVANLLNVNPKLYKQYETICIEDARYAHLQSLQTQMTITFNGSSLLNLFEKRCCENAQWEIRKLANRMLRLVKHKAPVIFANAGAPCTKGSCPEGEYGCGKQREKPPLVKRPPELHSFGKIINVEICTVTWLPCTRCTPCCSNRIYRTIEV